MAVSPKSVPPPASGSAPLWPPRCGGGTVGCGVRRNDGQRVTRLLATDYRLVAFVLVNDALQWLAGAEAAQVAAEEVYDAVLA